MTALSDESPEAVRRLSTRLGTLPDDPLPPRRADAAVLILIRSGPQGLEVLAEQRAVQTGDPWSGQVSLPGGRAENSDSSMRQTALRELHEEVGILPEALEGTPRPFDVRRARPSGLRVAVFVGRLLAVPEKTGTADPVEVTGTFWFPLAALRQIQSRPRPTMFGEIPVETVEFDGHIVWGFTLRLLRDFDAWLWSDRPGPSESRGDRPPTRSQAL